MTVRPVRGATEVARATTPVKPPVAFRCTVLDPPWPDGNFTGDVAVTMKSGAAFVLGIFDTDKATSKNKIAGIISKSVRLYKQNRPKGDATNCQY